MVPFLVYLDAFIMLIASGSNVSAQEVGSLRVICSYTQQVNQPHSLSLSLSFIGPGKTALGREGPGTKVICI